MSVLAFLAFVTVLVGFDADNRVALYALPIWAVLLVGGYSLYGKKAMARASTAHPTTTEQVQPASPAQA